MPQDQEFPDAQEPLEGIFPTGDQVLKNKLGTSDGKSTM